VLPGGRPWWSEWAAELRAPTPDSLDLLTDDRASAVRAGSDRSDRSDRSDPSEAEDATSLELIGELI
jgi:hypothetical protein